MEYFASPARITAGDTTSWTYRNSCYPASSGWVLTAYFSSADETPQTCEATANEDGVSFDFSLSPGASDALTPGRVHFTLRAVSADGLLIRTVAYGTTLVRPNPATATDRRTQNEKDLEAVEAGISARLQGTIMNEYVIGGVTCKMPPLEKLLEIRAALKSLINQERGGQKMRSIPVRLAPGRGGIVPFGLNRRRW